MRRDYMELPASVREAVARSRAKIIFGYPWWLRPLMMRHAIAITLGRRIYVSTRVAAHGLERLLRHELAHVAQIERHGLAGFYLRYAAEFVRHLRRERNVHRAYAMISFEREAAAAEESL